MSFSNIERQVISDYRQHIEHYETYKDLMSALEKDDRLTYPENDAAFSELATAIVRYAGAKVCDICSKIIPEEGAFLADYAEAECWDDMTVLLALAHEKKRDTIEVLCQDCYIKMLHKGSELRKEKYGDANSRRVDECYSNLIR